MIKKGEILLMLALLSLLTACDEAKMEYGESSLHRLPMMVALNSMGKHFQNEMTNLTLTQQVSGELPTEAIVIIEESGIQDDSIAAKRTVFSLVNKDQRWIIASQVETQKCYPERGHQDFSSHPCL